jgi:hypothetical protein
LTHSTPTIIGYPGNVGCAARASFASYHCKERPEQSSGFAVESKVCDEAIFEQLDCFAPLAMTQVFRLRGSGGNFTVVV